MARSKIPEEQHCQKVSISFDPEQLKQMTEYCQREERTYSWVVRKALEMWFKDKGY